MRCQLFHAPSTLVVQRQTIPALTPNGRSMTSGSPVVEASTTCASGSAGLIDHHFRTAAPVSALRSDAASIATIGLVGSFISIPGGEAAAVFSSLPLALKNRPPGRSLSIIA